MRTNSHWDVIVVGGGLAGLSAGATAAGRGARTLVLEAHQAGGRARVAQRDGFVFNMGAHALYVKGPGWGVLAALGVKPVGTAPPLEHYRLWYGGQAHVMPSSVATMVRTTALSARSKTQLARLLAAMPLMKPAKVADISVSQWLGGYELRPDAAALARALVRIGTYSDDHDHLSADAALRQLQIAARHGVLYLDGGWAQLIDGLAAQVEVRTGTTVQSLDPAARRVGVVTHDGTYTAGSVVLAVGSPKAARRLLPADPGWGELGDAVSVACLDVASRRVPRPGWVLGVDDPVYATTQSPPARQSPEGQAVVSAVRYGTQSAPDDRLVLENYLSHAGVGRSDVLFDRFLARMAVAATQPLAQRGGLAGRPATEDSGVPNVFLAGDWVGPDGLLADAALASGYAAGMAAAWSSSPSGTMVA